MKRAVNELIAEVMATANPRVAGEGWVTDVHGVTPDVIQVEAAADELEQRLGE